MQEDKCQKYEGLFVFSDDATFQSHLEDCADCRAEHERMKRVSELLQEVKPHFLAKRKRFVHLQIACAVSFVLLSGTVLGLINNFDHDITDRIKYGSTLDAQDLGFPVDDYGFIMVE